MGSARPAMAGTRIERIERSRLRAVAQHVRTRLARGGPVKQAPRRPLPVERRSGPTARQQDDLGGVRTGDPIPTRGSLSSPAALRWPLAGAAWGKRAADSRSSRWGGRPAIIDGR